MKRIFIVDRKWHIGYYVLGDHACFAVCPVMHPYMTGLHDIRHVSFCAKYGAELLLKKLEKETFFDLG